MKHRIVAISDLHGTLPAVPPCDLLLLAGDVTPVRNHRLRYQAEWLDTEFRAWLDAVPAAQVVLVAGNHDLVFQQEPTWVPRGLRCAYLQDSALVWRGLKIWGTPWQPWFFDWAFNLREPELKAKWDLVPDDTDILVVHGPPHGFGDAVPRADGVEHTGSPSLLARIRAVAPRLVVFGHIHEGRGEWRLGDTVLANVTLVNAAYEAVYPPWKMELETPGAVSRD